MTSRKDEDPPALFATIHFRSERRPAGYTNEEIARLNELANEPSRSENPGEKPPSLKNKE